MWVFLTRRLRMWVLFSVVIPLVRKLWGRAKANRVARKAQPGGSNATAGSIPASAKDSRTL